MVQDMADMEVVAAAAAAAVPVLPAALSSTLPETAPRKLMHQRGTMAAATGLRHMLGTAVAEMSGEVEQTTGRVKVVECLETSC